MTRYRLRTDLAGALRSPLPLRRPPTPSAPSDPCGSILSIVNRPTVTTGVCTVRHGHVRPRKRLHEHDHDRRRRRKQRALSAVAAAHRHGRSASRFRVRLPERRDVIGRSANRQRASTDISLATKYELGYSSNADWGVYGAVTYPTGSKAFTAGNAQFTGDFNGAYTINSEFSLAGTLSFNALSAANAAGAPAVLLRLHSKLGAQRVRFPAARRRSRPNTPTSPPAGPALGAKSLIDFVYQRDFGNHVQFDVEYGFSPTVINGQKQHYIGAGLSFMN